MSGAHAGRRTGGALGSDGATTTGYREGQASNSMDAAEPQQGAFGKTAVLQPSLRTPALTRRHQDSSTSAMSQETRINIVAESRNVASTLVA